MSDQAPEASSSRRRENAFTRRIGPLPMWQWLLIALAMVGVYVIYQYRKNNQQAASAANTAGGTPTGGTAGAGQVPQFVNQTNTYVAPPMAPQPPPSAVGQVQPSPSGTLPRPGGGLPGPGRTFPGIPAAAPATAVPWTGPGAGQAYSTVARALASAGYTISSVTRGGSPVDASKVPAGSRVYSITAYSNKTARIGLN